MFDDHDNLGVSNATVRSPISARLSEAERKKGVNLNYLTGYLLIISIGMFQFGMSFKLLKNCRLDDWLFQQCLGSDDLQIGPSARFLFVQLTSYCRERCSNPRSDGCRVWSRVFGKCKSS